MKPEDDEDQWPTPTVTLGHDGKVMGREPAPEPVPPFEPEAPLELVEPQPISESAGQVEEPAPPPPPPLPGSRATALGLVAALLLLAGLSAFLIGHRRGAGISLEPERPVTATKAPAAPPALERAAQASKAARAEAKGLLTIESNPPGATIFLDDEEVGRTPYLGSNVYPPGAAVRVRLRRPGYNLWTGSFAGGVDVRFNARLTAAR